MAEEKIFVKGFNGFAPRDGAPEYVLGSLIISIDDFARWIKDEADKYIQVHKQYGRQLKLDISRSKDGSRVNFIVNTYKGEGKKETPIVDYSRNDKDNLPF